MRLAPGRIPTCEPRFCRRTKYSSRDRHAAPDSEADRVVWPGFACKVDWVGREASSLPLRSLSLSSGQPLRRACPRLQGRWGLYGHLKEPNLCSVLGERIPLPQRKDRWSQRPMHSWGQFDCKVGQAGGSEASPLYIHEARAAQHANEAGRGGRLRRLRGGGGGCWLGAAGRERRSQGVSGRR